MTPKEQYRLTRRSLRYDAAKMSKGLGEKYPPLLMRWLRIPGTNRQMLQRSYDIPFSNEVDGGMSKAYSEWYAKQKCTFAKVPKRFPGAARLRQMREVERYLRDTWAHAPGFKYLPEDHPVRIAAQEKARTYEPHFMDDFRWRNGDATLPPPVEYAPVKQLRRVRQAPEKTDPYYVPPQLWLPEDVLEAETASSHSDPLVILLEREGSYHEAYELRQSHRAGTTQTVLKFYMEQRPDRYPQTLPGTVWVSQSSGTSEVKTQVRIRKKVA